MNEWVKRGLMLSMVVGAIGVGASACADNESTIFVRQVLVPSGSDCSYTADPGSMARMQGTMDLAFTREYWAALLIGNQLVERGSAEVLRTETSRFRAEGAEVEIEDTDGGSIKAFTVPVSGFADPGSGSEPGWGVVMAVLIDAETGTTKAEEFSGGERSGTVDRVVVAVRVFGKTLGGQEIESAEFRFPISLCYGCLISFPPDAMPNCENIGESGGAVEMPCFIGQDEPIDCRVCRSMGIGDLCVP